MVSVLSQFEYWDKEILIYIQKYLNSSWGDHFFNFITDLHKNIYFILFFVIPLLAFWIKSEGRKALYRLFGLILTLSLNDFICGSIIKKVFTRSRPFEIISEIIQKSPASGYSFVSNHAANMMALSIYLGFYYPSQKKYWWFLTFLVGFSRIYNGVHYPSDVIFGVIIGASIAYFFVRLWNKLFESGVVK